MDDVPPRWDDDAAATGRNCQAPARHDQPLAPASSHVGDPPPRAHWPRFPDPGQGRRDARQGPEDYVGIIALPCPALPCSARHPPPHSLQLPLPPRRYHPILAISSSPLLHIRPHRRSARGKSHPRPPRRAVIKLHTSAEWRQRQSAPNFPPTLPSTLRPASNTVKLAFTTRNTPPPLHYSPASARDSSRESTPVSTPRTASQHSYPQPSLRQPGQPLDPHSKKRTHSALEDTLTSDDILFPPEDDNQYIVPLFPSEQPAAFNMPSSASPIDIATSRQASGSPRSQQSNLTSGLQQPRIDVYVDDSAKDMEQPQKPRQESISMLGTTPLQGARSIPAKDGQRRGSYNNGLSGSLVNGMSWGGLSVGSFIRDDVLMAGTSPYNFQSPSFHSSSYLPKMEANYMKNYVCCDIPLDSMHELLQHYEEAHAAQPTQTMGRTPKDHQYPSSRAANATSTAQAVQQQSQMPQQNMGMGQHPQQHQQRNVSNASIFGGNSADQMSAFDGLDDMDMDDSSPPQAQQQQGSQFQPQPTFGRQQPRGPSVNVNIANAFQGQGLNSATPTTPHAPQQGFQGNPTVSSVNTPTLGSQTAWSQNNSTPDSSMPGTPAELDTDFAAQMSNLGVDYNQLMQGGYDFNKLNLNNGNLNSNSNSNHGGSGTIDDPAKRLLSKQGQGNNKGYANPAFANSSELAKRVKEAQLLNGLAGVSGFVNEEIKPFKCPVIGCEKAYKNQNGLKYHKQHGHQNQQLKENADGTFSIVDPATSIPYPGTVGMEKEKPYRCEVCGKRYKNLNGLKYHRQHSPPCNPDFKMNAPNVAGVPANMQVNVAGAGLDMDGMNGY